MVDFRCFQMTQEIKEQDREIFSLRAAVQAVVKECEDLNKRTAEAE